MNSKYRHGFSSCILTIILLSLSYTPLHAITETSFFNSSLSSNQRYGIKVSAPDIAENGAVVSVSVDMFGFENTDVYVQELKLFVCHMGFRPIQKMIFHRPTSKYRTRIRLNKTDSIFAMAKLTTGEYVYAQKHTKVTLGGCGGGVSLPYSTEAIADASTPSGTANQHARTWLKSTLPSNTMRLLTNNGRWLEQKAMRVDVKIAGHRARILLDMEFYNPYNNQGEGRFQLRLPESAVPYYIAFGDVVYLDKKDAFKYLPSSKTSGFSKRELQFDRQQHPAKFKEAVMVPRKKARNAYETIVGKRRDPALVEWQGNGIYSVNVFPLQPYSSHRVAIAYDMELPKTKDGHLEYVFNTPNRKMPIDVYLHIDKASAEQIRSLNLIPELASRGETRLYHFKPKHNETLEVKFKDRDARYLHGNDPGTGDYFSAQLKLPLPKEIAQHSNDNAIFAIDSSISRNGNVFGSQLNMMLNMLEANQDDIKHFAVLFFDVGTHWWQKRFVANTAVNRHDLTVYAQRISLLGATDLQRALTEVAKPHWFHTDMATSWDVFLFTDGYATWGDTRPAALLNSVKGNNKHDHISHLYAYIEHGQKVDMDILDLLTHETRGAIYDFSRFELASENKNTNTHQVMRAHRMRHWRVVNAYARGAEDIFIANASYYTFANQPVHFVGRGRPDEYINVVLKGNDEVQEIKLKMPTNIIETDLTPRIYAEAAVRKLEDSPDQHETLTLAYATHFRIPRQTVSLLMLETQKDYDRFKINNQVDFEDYVNEHYVAHVIAKLSPPDFQAASLADHHYQVPALPVTQLEDISQINHAFTICKIPSAYMPNINIDQFSTKKPLTHLPLQLNTQTIMQKVDLGYYYYLDTATKERIVSKARRFRSRNQPQASLRLLSSIMEVPNVSFEDRVMLSTQLINQGYGNEGYFLLSMVPNIFGRTGMFDLLIKSVELQNEPEYAQALRKMSRLDQVFNKLALEP